MVEHVIVSEDKIEDGERILVELKGREIGIFRLDGDLYAYSNWCPHQGGPICEGACTGRQEAEYDAENRRVELEWTDEGEILTCPWHDWEFDLKTGKNIPREEIQLLSYPVRTEDEKIVVTI